MSSAAGKTAPAAAAASPTRSRKPPSHYFQNFVCKGIQREMSDRKKYAEEEALIEQTVCGGIASDGSPGPTACYTGEVNKSKVFALAGDPSRHPPYHIMSDDHRIRASGSLIQTTKRLDEGLRAADANRDGKVSYAEFAAVIRRLEGTKAASLSDGCLLRMACGLDPEGTGKIAIEDAVAVYARRLATMPSQRSSLGESDPLLWITEAQLRPGVSKFGMDVTEAADHYSLRPQSVFVGSLSGSLSFPAIGNNNANARRPPAVPASDRSNGLRSGGLFRAAISTRSTRLLEQMKAHLAAADLAKAAVPLSARMKSGSARARVAPAASAVPVHPLPLETDGPPGPPHRVPVPPTAASSKAERRPHSSR